MRFEVKESGPSHIILAGDRKPQIIKRYGVNYIIAPDAAEAAKLWVALVYEENE